MTAFGTQASSGIDDRGGFLGSAQTPAEAQSILSHRRVESQAAPAGSLAFGAGQTWVRVC